ncbi:MAG: hypothetical protein AAF125_22665 [Chloroflexota bacterium]
MMRKREALSRMMRAWLEANRHGRLASDQWLNLVTAPLLTLLFLAVPVSLVFIFTPARLFLRFGNYGRFVLPALAVGLLLMLVFRARRYARLPVYHGVFYGADHRTARELVGRNLKVYTEKGEPVLFDRFAGTAPHLEPDAPYIVYYLVDGERRTLLSAAPGEHPDANRWEPTGKFYERQKQRR